MNMTHLTEALFAYAPDAQTIATRIEALGRATGIRLSARREGNRLLVRDDTTPMPKLYELTLREAELLAVALEGEAAVRALAALQNAVSDGGSVVIDGYDGNVRCRVKTADGLTVAAMRAPCVAALSTDLMRSMLSKGVPCN